MVRYERPSLAARWCLPLVSGLSRPFKPKIIRLLLAALFWLLAFVWMIICGNLSTFRYTQEQATLPDLLFDIFPHHKVYPLPEVFLYTLLTSAIGRMIFHKDGVAIARRFATIAAFTYVLRGLTLIVTSLPAALSACTAYGASWSMAVVLADSCGDLMLGHAVNVVLAALAWGQYTKHRIVSVLAWMTAITAMILFIVDRSHYTIDVLLSLFIAVFCWKYYHTVLHLPLSSQSRFVRWMEGVAVGGADEERDTEEVTREGISLTTVVNEALGSSLGSSPGPSKYTELREESSVLA